MNRTKLWLVNVCAAVIKTADIEVAENTMTANKVLIAVIAFALHAKAYVILTP